MYSGSLQWNPVVAPQFSFSPCHASNTTIYLSLVQPFQYVRYSCLRDLFWYRRFSVSHFDQGPYASHPDPTIRPLDLLHLCVVDISLLRFNEWPYVSLPGRKVADPDMILPNVACFLLLLTGSFCSSRR